MWSCVYVRQIWCMAVSLGRETYITVIYTSANGLQGVHEMDWTKLYRVAHVSEFVSKQAHFSVAWWNGLHFLELKQNYSSPLLSHLIPFWWGIANKSHFHADVPWWPVNERSGGQIWGFCCSQRLEWDLLGSRPAGSHSQPPIHTH